VNARSWKASTQLKADVLRQIDEHYQRATLAPVAVSGGEVVIYDWPKPVSACAIRDAFAIPIDLLSVGSWTFRGFPEGEAGVLEVIAARREFFAAVPVGADLGNVAIELICFRLLDTVWGVRESVDDRVVRELLERTATSLVARDVAGVQARMQAVLAEWSAEIPRLWQSERRVDRRVYAHVGALDTALAACRMLTEGWEPSSALENSVYGRGSDGTGQEQAEQALQAELVRLLAEAATR
jgi:hypothetical protein